MGMETKPVKLLRPSIKPTMDGTLVISASTQRSTHRRVTMEEWKKAIPEDVQIKIPIEGNCFSGAFPTEKE
jgi:hypothetical protein